MDVSLDGSNDDADVVVITMPVLDGTLTWRFTETSIQRILTDERGKKVSMDTVSWNDATEDLWFG